MRILGVLLASAAVFGQAASAQSKPPAIRSSAEHATPTNALEQGFESPPMSARPRTWWHWISGNISDTGITRDLEWMKRIGIGGAMMFDGDLGAPAIVPQRITVLSPAWYDKLRFSAAEAERLGLEFAMAGAPGWSETGGPWVRPEQAMKKFVWSETRVQGGGPAGRLSPLPSVTGPFQTVPKQHDFGKASINGPTLARDVAILAFRVPAGDVPLTALRPAITSNVSNLALDKLVDGDPSSSVELSIKINGTRPWIRFDFGSRQTIRAFTYVGPLGGRFGGGPGGRIERSDDGVNWSFVRRITGESHLPAPQRTFAFPATTARYVRVLFDQPNVSREPWPQPATTTISELAPVPGARVNLFEDRAGFGVLTASDEDPTPTVAPAEVVRSSGILNLTHRLRPNGTLDWRVPPGNWIVLRTGWSLTGTVNHPATPEGTGLEVDKLDAASVRSHLDAYLGPVISRLGGLSGNRGLRFLLTDSWEAGPANWTAGMSEEFRQRRGYELRPFLPVLAGRVVDSAERSDRFLWDFRLTLSELLAENHYGTITHFAKAHGLGYYGEATGASWPVVADGMLAKSQTDIPMGEFWAIPFGGEPAAYNLVPSREFPADIIETRSTAHVYGKPLVAAEAFTSSLPQWTSTPWKLKWVADKYMAMGVNRFVIHSSPHQPSDVHRPGLTLGPFGQTFSRHETWAEMASPWIDYLARGSFLLQQGVPVADILFFTGEGAPSGVPYRREGEPADLPTWGFDYVNADALLRLAKMVDGRISFPGGASYEVLVLPAGTSRMTLPLITRLRELVDQGAVLVGDKPEASPSLASDSVKVRKVADRLWGVVPTIVHRSGMGRVYARDLLTTILVKEGVGPDFEASPPNPAMEVRFAHRRTRDGDIYFVTNQSAVAGRTPMRFRVAEGTPELWDPATGGRCALEHQREAGFTTTELNLSAYEAAFVVFRRVATASACRPPDTSESAVATLANGWLLILPAVGAPLQVQPGSWTSSQDPRVRYFSGTGTYRNRLFADRAWFQKSRRVELELGNVGDVAEVLINGERAGVAWKPPYRVNITGAIKPGANAVEIRVANTWQNRLIGDLQPSAAKIASVPAAANAFPPLTGPLTRDTPLTPSGLLTAPRVVLVDD